MKKRQIKVWPETIHYLPSVSPFQGIAGTANDIRIDFSACRQVTSTGLTVLLLRLLRLLSSGPANRKWETDNMEANPVFDTVLALGFFDHLNKYCTNQSLFGKTNYSGPFQKTEHAFLYGRKVTSFPILQLKFSQYSLDRRRAALIPFKKELFMHLLSLESIYQIHANQLASILLEMTKNSADHTEGDAFFGMDVIDIPERKTMELHFVFGDLGKGIKQHIQDHLPSDLKYKRDEHWSLYESYYFALKHGYTSTPQNIKNKGLGMSIILDGAQAMNVELSVFDANSRGILSSLKNTSHEELRRNFIKFTKDKGFYYYGSVESEAL